MKKLLLVTKIIMYLIAIFFILMSFDAFETSNSVWENVSGFLIHASIGIILFFDHFFSEKT